MFLNLTADLKLKIGNTISELFNQEEGVHQCSIVSVTLFSVKINSIDKY